VGAGCGGVQAETAMAAMVDLAGCLACRDRSRCRIGRPVGVLLQSSGTVADLCDGSFGTKSNKNSAENTGSSSGAGDSTSSQSSSPSSSSKGSKPTSTASAGVPLFTGATTGTDGSQILFSNGSTVTYRNRHGGKWAYDPSNPLINDAQSNSWTPPLSQPWKWEDRMFGVNLGGW
jgi:hypothetical protein